MYTGKLGGGLTIVVHGTTLDAKLEHWVGFVFVLQGGRSQSRGQTGIDWELISGEEVDLVGGKVRHG